MAGELYNTDFFPGEINKNRLDFFAKMAREINCII
jgi:hypothetical protein